MQQAATLAQQAPSSAADGNVAPGALRNAFVINLTSSTTPVALTRPEHAGLRRFTFFVSRRREEGRERFRLHMGYFNTQEEAEKLLDIVREIYPGAWAGLTPGRGLRGTPAVAQPPDVAPAEAAPTPASDDIPQRARVARPAAPGRSTVVTPITAVAPAAPTPVPASRAAVTPTVSRQPVSVERRIRTEVDRQAAVQSLDDVRDAIDALEDSAGAAAAAALLPKKPRIVPTLHAASMPAAQPARLAAVPPATAASSAKSAARSAPRSAVAPMLHPTQPAPPVQPTPRAMSERAVLDMLEGAAQAARKAAVAARSDERPSYAVQLAWSAEPIDLARVPQLAIFNAYTLYGAQGHRDGRRWFGLRLGFFTDAVSARQVAQYVRSDFATVAVVPVSSRERDQAKGASAAVTAPKPATVVPVPGAARFVRPAPVGTAARDEFKFIDDAAANAVPKNSGAPRAQSKSRGSLRPGRGAPGKRAVFRAGRIHATSKAKQMTLEETLEILGANDLEVTTRKKPTVSQGDVSTPVTAVPAKPSKLSRLFERLSERLGT